MDIMDILLCSLQWAKGIFLYFEMDTNNKINLVIFNHSTDLMSRLFSVLSWSPLSALMNAVPSPGCVLSAVALILEEPAHFIF